MNSEMIIRTASEADAPVLLEIYAPYVERTAITFEYEVPSVDEFASRIRNTLQKYPYLVAEKGGRILGYAYAGPFHDRPAYDWSVETSIYVDTFLKHMGIGVNFMTPLNRLSSGTGNPEHECLHRLSLHRR